MVQPYLGAVESQGETAIVFIDGHESHALRKDVILGPDQEAPLADSELGAAEAMFSPELVRAAEAGDAERELAAGVVATLAARFGTTPLYARIDMIAGPDREPLLLELEAVEPSLYFVQAPGAADRFAEALLRRLAKAVPSD